MKNLLLIIVAAIAAYGGYVHYHPRVSETPTANAAALPAPPTAAQGRSRPSEAPPAETSQSDSVLANAFKNQLSNVHVQGQGLVTRVLADDNDGSRHQRFIIRLGSGQTILIAHNIDLAPRISSLGEGDAVSFDGQYEWNPKGGVVHWTHRDPSGRHPTGWLKHKGQTFQ